MWKPEIPGLVGMYSLNGDKRLIAVVKPRPVEKKSLLIEWMEADTSGGVFDEVVPETVLNTGLSICTQS